MYMSTILWNLAVIWHNVDGLFNIWERKQNPQRPEQKLNDTNVHWSHTAVSTGNDIDYLFLNCFYWKHVIGIIYYTFNNT